jgi:hypothetical protein
MLTYPQNLVSRFCPMADGAMSVAADHAVPCLSMMNTPCAIPEKSLTLDGSGGGAAEGLRKIHRRLKACGAASILEDKSLRRATLGTKHMKWEEGASSINWVWSRTTPGDCFIALKDADSGATVRLDSDYDDGLIVAVERSVPWGSFSQENRIDARGNVKTRQFEIHLNFGEALPTLPFFSQWPFVKGGLSCFDPSVFLIDLMELALGSQSGQGPLAYSFRRDFLESTGDLEFDLEETEEGFLGTWEVPETDQTVALSTYSDLRRSLSETIPGVQDQSLALYFSLHKRGDARRGAGRNALPVSIEGGLLRGTLVMTLENTEGGLMNLPKIFLPVFSAFFPSVLP